jgi:hypothetical protein
MKKGHLISTALATVLLTAVPVGHAAREAKTGTQAPGDPIRLGLDNDGATSETLLRSDPTGDKATLAIFNETTTCPGACTVMPDTVRAFAGDQGGAAIQAFAGSGTFGTLNLSGIAIRGIGNRTGVWGRARLTAGTGVRAEALGAGGNGLHASGPRAILAEGQAEGILASCSGAGCAAVKGSASLGGLALEAAGRVSFTTAGIAVVPAGVDRVAISPGVDVHADTKVLVTEMSSGGSFKFVARDFAADTLSFRLGKRATNDLTLAYFVIG